MNTAQGHSQFAQYRLVDRLGAGGIGEVFRAWDTRLRRDVAIKSSDGEQVPREGRSQPHSPPGTRRRVAVARVTERGDDALLRAPVQAGGAPAVSLAPHVHDLGGCG
jgi:hypothetical protein